MPAPVTLYPVFVSTTTGESFHLTNREVEVLRLISQGFSNKLIGACLEITPHTAKFHVCNVIKKLGADNRAQAAGMAVRMGVAQ